MTPQNKGIKHLYECKEILQNDEKKSLSIVEMFKLLRCKKARYTIRWS